MTHHDAWVDRTKLTHPEAIASGCGLLCSQRYGTLSTCSEDGSPWGTPLLFVWDNQPSLYWSSAIAARHSHNLSLNQGRAMFSLYDPGQIKGLYLSGIATALTEQAALHTVLKHFDQRSARATPRQAQDYLGRSPRRMYQLIVQQAWLSGDRQLSEGQLIDTKIELDVSRLAQALQQLTDCS